MGTRITVFAAAAALFADSDTNLRGRPPDPSILMDARQIIGLSLQPQSGTGRRRTVTRTWNVTRIDVWTRTGG